MKYQIINRFSEREIATFESAEEAINTPLDLMIANSRNYTEGDGEYLLKEKPSEQELIDNEYMPIDKPILYTWKFEFLELVHKGPYE